MTFSKFSKIITALLFMLASMMLVQCTDDSDDSYSNLIEEEREALVTSMEDLKDAMDDQIKELESRLDRAGDAADEGLVEAYEELKDDRSELERAIDDIKNATQDSWERVKEESMSAYDDISSDFNDWMESITE